MLGRFGFCQPLSLFLNLLSYSKYFNFYHAFSKIHSMLLSPIFLTPNLFVPVIKRQNSAKFHANLGQFDVMYVKIYLRDISSFPTQRNIDSFQGSNVDWNNQIFFRIMQFLPIILLIFACNHNGNLWNFQFGKSNGVLVKAQFKSGSTATLNFSYPCSFVWETTIFAIYLTALISFQPGMSDQILNGMTYF